jgi:hypothetical protein
MADAGGASPPPAAAEASGEAGAAPPRFQGDLTKVRVVLRLRPLLRREYGYPLAAERLSDTRCVPAARSRRLQAAHRTRRAAAYAASHAAPRSAARHASRRCRAPRCHRAGLLRRGARSAAASRARAVVLTQRRPRHTLSLRLFAPRAEVLSEADAVLDETSTQEEARAGGWRSGRSGRERGAHLGRAAFDRLWRAGFRHRG